MYLINLKNNKILFSFVMTFFLMCLPVKAELFYANLFALKASELRDICLQSENSCDLWVDGVVEGIEFVSRIQSSTKTNQDQILCIDKDTNYLKDLRENFLNYMKENERNQKVLNGPAILSLSMGFENYFCFDKNK